MQSLKKTVAVVLSVLMLMSAVVAVNVVSVSAADKASVTLSAKNDFFNDVTNEYSKGSHFDAIFMLQCDKLVMNSQLKVSFDHTKLHVTDMTALGGGDIEKFSGTIKNYSDKIQEEDNMVTANFSLAVGVFDYTEKAEVLRVTFEVLDASEPVSVVFDYYNLSVDGTGNGGEYIKLIDRSTVNAAYKNIFSIDGTLSEAEEPISTETETETVTETQTQTVTETQTDATETVTETQTVTTTETSTETESVTSTEPVESGSETETSTDPVETETVTETETSTSTETQTESQTESQSETATETQAPTEKPTEAPKTPTKAQQEKALKPGANADKAVEILTKVKTDEPAGTTFQTIKAKASKVAKTSVKLTWSKVKGATKYIVMGNKCGKTNGEFNAYKKLKTLGKSATLLTIKKISGAKVRKNTYYKFIVIAVKGKKVLTTSKTIHAATTGGKYTNAKSLTVNAKIKKNKITLKKGKTIDLKAKVVKLSKKLTYKSHRAIQYETSNKSVAEVSSKGVIKAKKKGTAYIYAYAQNGVYTEIKVTVK